MNIIEVRAEFEEELTWRVDEIRLLHNQLGYIRKEADKMRYRKALVVMLYSHFEGFCKTAFSITRHSTPIMKAEIPKARKKARNIAARSSKIAPPAWHDRP